MSRTGGGVNPRWAAWLKAEGLSEADMLVIRLAILTELDTLRARVTELEEQLTELRDVLRDERRDRDARIAPRHAQDNESERA